MFNHEDENLKEMKQTHENVSSPANIDAYIHAGIAKAKKKRKFSKGLKIATLAASLLFATLFTSAQLSPAFANYLKTVPGINLLVGLLGGADKGIHEAVTNDYIQEIGASDTIGDQTFTVDHIIFDRSRMIIFYTFNIGNADESEERRLSIRPNIVNGGGEDLTVGTSWGRWTGEGKEKKGRIEVSYYDPIDLPDNVTVQVHLEEWDQETHSYNIVNEGKTFAVSFVPNKEKFFKMEEEIVLNQPISFEGFNFVVDSAVIYPTQIAVHFSGLDQNDYKLLSFQDFHLVDETGEEWNFIKGYGSGEKTYTMYFESNFFKNRKSLALKGSTLTALPKEDVIVALDIKEQKLLKTPYDRITFDGIEPSYHDENYMNLRFSLTLNDDDPNPSYFSFAHHLMNKDGSIKVDEEGNRSDYVGSISTGHNDMIDENDIAYASIEVEKEVLESEDVIYLKLQNYPNFLINPFSIQIK
jgi:hypothetical protein